MDLSSRDLRIVTAIDFYSHFGRAAEALGISQPALSRRLKALERRLGEPLFRRGRAGVHTTDLGRLVADRGQPLLADLADLERALDRARDEGTGSLAVAVGHYPAELTVAPAVGALLAARPGLRFTLRSQEWVTIRQALISREADLGLFETSVAETDDRFACKPVGQHPVFAFARAGHPLSRVGRPGLAELLKFPWAAPMIPWRAASRFGLDHNPVAAGSLDFERQLFVPRVLAPFPRLAKDVASASDCISLGLLTQIADELDEGSLVLIGYHGEWMYLQYGFAWLKRRPPGTAAVEFMRYVESAEARLLSSESDLRSRYWGDRPLGVG